MPQYIQDLRRFNLVGIQYFLEPLDYFLLSYVKSLTKMSATLNCLENNVAKFGLLC